MLPTFDCHRLCFQGRSHLQGWSGGDHHLRRYRWAQKEWCDCFCRCHWWRKTSEPLRLVVHTQSLCFHVWPVPRPAVLGRHPAADPHHRSAPGRPLQGDVCAGRIRLNAATLRRWLGKSRLCAAADLCLIERCCFSSRKHEKQPAQSLIHWCRYAARRLIKDGTVICLV